MKDGMGVSVRAGEASGRVIGGRLARTHGGALFLLL